MYARKDSFNIFLHGEGRKKLFAKSKYIKLYYTHISSFL